MATYGGRSQSVSLVEAEQFVDEAVDELRERRTARYARSGAVESQDMTTKERLHELVDELSEQEAADTLQYVVARRVNGNADADEWGDLDAQTYATTIASMRELDEEEAAIGFSWPQREPS